MHTFNGFIGRIRNNKIQSKRATVAARVCGWPEALRWRSAGGGSASVAAAMAATDSMVSCYELESVATDVVRGGWRRVRSLVWYMLCCRRPRRHCLSARRRCAVADRGCRAQVALQFPDHLLQDSVGVAAWLSQRVVGRTFFVIGDTSYGRWEPPRSSSSSTHTRMVYCSLHAVPPSPLATAG
eukprot:COSAG01_NODE_18635_length_1063_cov_1.153527_1_plen_183_part_00